MTISFSYLVFISSLLLFTPHNVKLDDNNIRVGDVAKNSGALSNVVISSLPSNSKEITLSEADQLMLLRKTFPTYNFSLRHKGKVNFSSDFAVPNKNLKRNCYNAKGVISKGSPLTKDLIIKTNCSDTVIPVNISYDREMRAAIATETIESGAYLGRLFLNDKEVVRKGTKLTFMTEHGPVIIKRDVIALQSAQHGQNIFVKTGDGKIITSKLIVNTKGNENGKTK